MAKYKIESSGSGTTIRKEYRETLKAARALAHKRAKWDERIGGFMAGVYERVETRCDYAWELVGSVTRTSSLEVTVRTTPAECRESVEQARREIDRLELTIRLAKLRAEEFTHGTFEVVAGRS